MSTSQKLSTGLKMLIELLSVSQELFSGVDTVASSDFPMIAESEKVAEHFEFSAFSLVVRSRRGLSSFLVAFPGSPRERVCERSLRDGDLSALTRCDRRLVMRRKVASLFTATAAFVCACGFVLFGSF